MSDVHNKPKHAWRWLVARFGDHDVRCYPFQQYGAAVKFATKLSRNDESFEMYDVDHRIVFSENSAGIERSIAPDKHSKVFGGSGTYVFDETVGPRGDWRLVSIHK